MTATIRSFGSPAGTSCPAAIEPLHKPLCMEDSRDIEPFSETKVGVCHFFIDKIGPLRRGGKHFCATFAVRPGEHGKVYVIKRAVGMFVEQVR